jgi:hypothetical protein
MITSYERSNQNAEKNSRPFIPPKLTYRGSDWIGDTAGPERVDLFILPGVLIGDVTGDGIERVFRVLVEWVLSLGKGSYLGLGGLEIDDSYRSIADDRLADTSVLQ